MKIPSLSLKELLDGEKTRFFRFVRKRLARISQMDAEDIVSDVFLAMLRRADVFGEIENLTAYVYRALENRIIDFKRGGVETLSLDDEENQEFLASNQALNHDSAETDASRLELREKLLWAVGRLSPLERALWIATTIEGRGFGELAREWDEPIGTLLSRKSRANARLRELLKDYNPK